MVILFWIAVEAVVNLSSALEEPVVYNFFFYTVLLKNSEKFQGKNPQ